MELIVWDLVEKEMAIWRWFVNDNARPAFFAMPSLTRGGQYDLMFNAVCCIGTYKTLKMASDAVRTLVENANTPVRVTIQCRGGKRKFFAENVIDRVDWNVVKGPIKVFNI